MKITELLRKIQEKYPRPIIPEFRIFSDESGEIKSPEVFGWQKKVYCKWHDEKEMHEKLTDLNNELDGKNEKWEL